MKAKGRAYFETRREAIRQSLEEASKATTQAASLAEFIRERARETYPEPRSKQHDSVTALQLPRVCEHVPKGALVLDVGCGQGPALEWFKANGYDALGTGTNTEDLQACHKAGFEVMHLDMHEFCTRTMFDSPCYDLIWARHVMEHSVAPFYVLSEFGRILKSGGILYVEVPAPDTPCCHAANPNHYSVLGSQMWLSLIVSAGFEVLEYADLVVDTPAGDDTYLSFICRRK